MVKVPAQPAYFTLNPAPHGAKTMGNSSFELESAQTLGVNNQWQIRLRGLCDGVAYRLNTVIGHRRIQIPNGVVAVGTGAASSVVLQLQAGSPGASYDPSPGPYDPLNPGEE